MKIAIKFNTRSNGWMDVMSDVEPIINLWLAVRLKLNFVYLRKRIVVSSTLESTYYIQNIGQDDPEGDS